VTLLRERREWNSCFVRISWNVFNDLLE